MEVLVTGYNKESDEFSVNLQGCDYMKSVSVPEDNISAYLKAYFFKNTVKANQKESNAISSLQKAGFTDIKTIIDKQNNCKLTAVKEITHDFKINISFDSESKEWRVHEAAIFFTSLDRLLEYVEDTPRLLEDCRPLVTVSFPTILPMGVGRYF